MTGRSFQVSTSTWPCSCSHPTCYHTLSACRNNDFRIAQLASDLKQAKFATTTSRLSLHPGPKTARNYSRIEPTSVIPHAQMSGAAEPGGSKIGFCGLGIMGTPMALNLLKAGYHVTVWNRSSEKCKPLHEAGATVAGSPKEVAEQSDIILAMLADPAAAIEVAGSVAEGIKEGVGYVDISTIDARTANSIKEAIHSSGGSYLEAPVSGSKQPAEQGALIFLCGGDEDLYRYASPLLDVMGKARFFLGEVGNGANMKLVVNMVMGSMMASFAEGLALAEAAGLSPNDFLEVSGLGAIAAPMFAMKGPNMIKGNFPTAFPLKHQRKDLELAMEFAQATSQTLPVAAASTDVYKEAESRGLGDADFSAVLTALQK